MPHNTLTSRALCRLAAALSIALGLAGGLLSAAAFPPLLGRLMVDGGITSVPAQVVLGVMSIAGIALGVLVVARAVRFWALASEIDARRVTLATVVVVLTASVSLGTLEVATRLAFPMERLLTGDAFWLYRWHEGRRARPTEAAGTSPFNSARYDAELGWAPREGFRSDAVNINSRGVRGVFEDSPVKQEGARRVVVIGDSFTFGEDVGDDDTYPAALETMLEGVRVVNLGVLGYGTDQQLLRLKKTAFEYDPDLVVLGFFGPNVDRNVLSFRDAAKPRFELAGDGLRLTNAPVPGPDTEWPDPVPRFYVLALAHSLLGRMIDRTVLAPKWEITRRILDEFAAECALHGVPLLVAFYPAKPITFNTSAGDTEVMVGRWAASRGVSFINLRTSFSQMPMERRNEVFRGHWTQFGNRFVAEQLFGAIQSRDMLDQRATSPPMSR